MATMKTLNGYGFNATELNGKAASDYLQKTDTATNSAKLGGKAPEYYLQPRNLLDNSDFEIAQAGHGGKHGTTVYAADRWMQNDTTERTYTYITKNGHGALKCSTNTRIQQKLHLVDRQDYTAAFYINNTLHILNFTANGAENGSGAISVNKQSDGTYMFIISNIPVGRIVYEPVLYIGSYTAETLPPYVPKGYAAELAECQRYYYQSWTGRRANTFNGAIIREAISISRTTNVVFPQTMRISNPTVTLYSPATGHTGKASEFVSDTETDAGSVYLSRNGFALSSPANAFEIGKHYCIHYSVSADL